MYIHIYTYIYTYTCFTYIYIHIHFKVSWNGELPLNHAMALTISFCVTRKR